MGTAQNNGNAGRSIFLKNVRLSFPDLFVAKQFQGNPSSPHQYKATFLVKPGSENDKLIREAIQRAAQNKWNNKAEATVKQLEAHGSQKFCYTDGALKDYDGYEGMWALAATRNQDAGPPAVIDRNMTPLMVSDGKPYGGCYVNAKVSIWAQDNTYGKGIRCTLEAVQFASDGDAFSGAGPATTEGFEEVAETEEAGDLM